jgi:outer membrane protein assembly factor BamA
MSITTRAAAAVLAAALLAGGTPAAAQVTAGEPPATAGEASPASQADVFDLLRRIFKDPPSTPPPADPSKERQLQITVLPGVGYNPSAGFLIGASGALSKRFGDPATTRLSTAVVGVSYSTRQQSSLMFRFGASTAGNQWRFDGDNRVQWTSQDSYGIGMSPTPDSRVDTKFTYVKIYDVAYYRLAEGVYAGAGFHYSLHTNVRPAEEGDPAWDESAYVTYSRQQGFDLYGQASSGVSVNLAIDTRDNPVNASRGVMASISYRPFFKDFFGGDAAWQQTHVDLRTFVGLSKDRRQRLAFWAYGDLGSGQAPPYFDLPFLGSSAFSGRPGRGYTEGRYRGQELVYGEVEYRATLTRNGLVGAVAFLNTTTASNEQTGERLFDGFAAGGGVGLRISFNKRSRTNMCVDYAWGRQGSRGLYVALQEAF